MIDKALIIIIAMYALSISVVGVQYEAMECCGVTITNLDGVPVNSHILGFINQDELNQRTLNIKEGNYSDSGQNTTFYSKIETFTTGAAFVAWELVTLLSGTYIFNFLYLMGVPAIFVAGFVIIYLLLLSRAVIAYVRGV